MSLLIATFGYFALVFGAGFLMGPIRVLILEPAIGTTAAVACETPVLIAAMVLAARWLPGKAGLPPTVPTFAAMGLGALALQQVADLAVGIYLRGLTPSDIYASFASPAGAIYGVALAAFAAMPLIMNWHKTSNTT